MSDNDKLTSPLREIVGRANVIEDPETLKAFAVEGVTPRVLVSPGTIDETSKVIAHASSEDWPSSRLETGQK